MLKISNETKIGLLAAAAIAVGIWGFQFLKGINVLTASQSFYIRYNDVEGLRPSSPVFISGHQVGMRGKELCTLDHLPDEVLARLGERAAQLETLR